MVLLSTTINVVFGMNFNVLYNVKSNRLTMIILQISSIAITSDVLLIWFATVNIDGTSSLLESDIRTKNP